jgi:hypothetical protein
MRVVDKLQLTEFSAWLVLCLLFMTATGMQNALQASIAHGII